MKRDKYLILNTGSTSTKVAVYTVEGEKIYDKTVDHPADQLLKYPTIQSQYEFRCQQLEETIKESGFSLKEMAAIGARGGALIPICEGGTYLVDDYMCQAFIDSPVQHAANLGAQIAKHFGDMEGIRAYIVDPDVIDEMTPIARVCGLKNVERSAQWHALSSKAVVRKVAGELGKKSDEITAIVLHIGGGVSVALHVNGRTVDVNNCMHGDGPFSPERAGLLPSIEVLNLVFKRGMNLDEAKRELVGRGGLVSHLGTSDARKVEEMIAQGDEYARLVYHAMAYNFAKGIGALAAAAGGKVDAIGITGGLAYSKMLMDWVKGYVGFLAPVFIYPGECEMEAIFMGIRRVEKGEEEYKLYRKKERPPIWEQPVEKEPFPG